MRDSSASSQLKLTSPNIKNTSSNKNAFYSLLILSMSRLSAGGRDMLCQTTVWLRAGQYEKNSNNIDNITIYCVNHEEKQLQRSLYNRYLHFSLSTQ